MVNLDLDNVFKYCFFFDVTPKERFCKVLPGIYDSNLNVTKLTSEWYSYIIKYFHPCLTIQIFLSLSI